MYHHPTFEFEICMYTGILNNPIDYENTLHQYICINRIYTVGINETSIYRH